MEKDLKNLIYEIRNKKVMLIKDIASLYQIETKNINKNIKRNIGKFKEDYFMLSKEEYLSIKTKPLRSQFVILNDKNESSRFQPGTLNKEKNGRGSNLKYLPYAITKNGIITLVDILKSTNNLEITNKILNAFDENYSLDILPQAQELREENIISMIYEIRGKQVMLDTDLAFLYQCKNGTKEINQAVKNNIEKFPERFSWVLTDEEFYNLRSKILTTNYKKFNMARTYPRVFTEEGIVMLATILKTNIAVKVSIAIMDTFVAMRKYISSSLIEQSYINELVLKDNKRINVLEETFSKFEEKRKTNEIYFNGQIYDAYSKIVDLMNEAKKELIIIDRYADKKVLDMISKIKAKVILIVKNKPLLSKIDIDNYYKQYNNLTIKYNDDFHDRYLIIDKKKVYHLGASINHAGSKTFSINTISDKNIMNLLLEKIKNGD